MEEHSVEVFGHLLMDLIRLNASAANILYVWIMCTSYDLGS